MNLVPSVSPLSPEAPANRISEFGDLHKYLSAEAKTSSSFNPPSVARANDLQKAFLDVFHMIGGPARLALWADQNFEDYLKLMVRMAPTFQSVLNVHASGPVQIITAIPPSELDR